MTIATGRSAGTDAVQASATWVPTKLRYLLEVNPATPVELRAQSDRLVPFIPMEALGEDGSLDTTRERPVAELLSGYSYFANGDVLMAKVTPCFENGKAALVQSLPQEHGFGSTEITTLRASEGLAPAFLHYLVRSDHFRQVSIASMTGAGGLKRVPDEHIRSFGTVVPPETEQRAITDFLDRETAKIDALIDKQEQLIATLREDRAATIVHAVTKGLNASVKRRNSHVDWIGSIPAHWEIFKGTWIGTPFGSPAVPEDDVSTTGEIAFLKVSSLSSSKFYPDDPEWFVSSTYPAVSDFVAFPKRGAAIFTNKVNVVDFPAVIDPNLMGWKMLPGHNAYYYAFIIGTLSLEEIADVSSVPQLNTKHIAGLRLPRPPVHEQREIVNYLLAQCKKVDSLIDKSTEMIETLREYRSALITNAVTGKIDVGEAV